MENIAIDWESEETHLFLNTKTPSNEREQLERIANENLLKGHIWMATSGTQGNPKLVALSKQAFLASAKGVNAHIDASKEDAWLNILPLFHVGGMSIHARAYLSRSKLYDYSQHKWSPHDFCQKLTQHRISFTSLVPTQVYDLVVNNLPCAKTLRGVFVGGASLHSSLHEKAYQLGWPLIKTYGMTETCSQIAAAKTPNPKSKLTLLQHASLRIDTESYIWIFSPALLSGYVQLNDIKQEYLDPKSEGWLNSKDKGSFNEGFLEIYGRQGDYIKIGGEGMYLSGLENIWSDILIENRFSGDAALIDQPDDRLGKSLHVVVAKKDFSQILPLVEQFNRRVLPIAQIRNVFQLEKIPRSALNKVLKEELQPLL